MKSKQGFTEYYAKIYRNHSVDILRFKSYQSMERWFYYKVRLQVVSKKDFPLIECYKRSILSVGSLEYMIFKF